MRVSQAFQAVLREPRTVEAGDAKAVAIATLALIVFGILEFWPRHLPSWLPRWLFQTNPDSDASMGSRAR
jgi:hypothetical protein